MRASTRHRGERAARRGRQVRAAELGAPYKEVARRGARAAEAKAAAAAAEVRAGACVRARGQRFGAALCATTRDCLPLPGGVVAGGAPQGRRGAGCVRTPAAHAKARDRRRAPGQGEGGSDDELFKLKPAAALRAALYGAWQTEPWVPPAAAGGVVPKDARGSVKAPPMAAGLPTVRGPPPYAGGRRPPAAAPRERRRRCARGRARCTWRATRRASRRCAASWASTLPRRWSALSGAAGRPSPPLTASSCAASTRTPCARALPRRSGARRRRRCPRLSLHACSAVPAWALLLWAAAVSLTGCVASTHARREKEERAEAKWRAAAEADWRKLLSTVLARLRVEAAHEAGAPAACAAGAAEDAAPPAPGGGAGADGGARSDGDARGAVVKVEEI